MLVNWYEVYIEGRIQLTTDHLIIRTIECRPLILFPPDVQCIKKSADSQRSVNILSYTVSVEKNSARLDA